ncbi:hypothetical protein [Methylobacterium gregans]|uniref:Uncharacterized protein n=1 Tax=Methylobacterium gregans TaxID=374424 RepID=A0AA37HPI4_9HYPH|nr:hypothetical protein [Methylobacterium gregans]MDQ0523774.1 hypothetical protein [Methylobacterium gregans]GJD79375.1 hypothetical protein NBEOAGPD_2601 [Methylobacterium gregans]
MYTMYAQGCSDAEVMVALARAGTVSLSRDLWLALQDRNPEFSAAVKKGHALAEAWWAAAGRDGIAMGKDFNATTYIFNMKNRFHHSRDRQDVDVTTKGKEMPAAQQTVNVVDRKVMRDVLEELNNEL